MTTPERDYPWSALGVSPEADESEIKRAYARLLKAFRPDEDADAFQLLVEARNAALAHARRAKAPRLPESPPREVPQSEPVLFEPAEPDVPIAETPKARILWEEPSTETPSASHAPRNDLPDILSVILAGLKLNARPSDLDDAQKALEGLTFLPAGARKLAEPKLLQALASLAPFISGRVMSGRSPSILQRLFRQKRDDPEKKGIAMAQVQLARRLNEEFGWTEADRRLHTLVGGEAASSIILYLNAFQRWFEATNAGDNGGRLRAPPAVGERDARAYFGDHYGTYAPLLAKVRSGSRWPVRWNTGVFLVLPAWLLGTRHYQALCIWVLAFGAALFMVAQSHSIQNAGAPYAALVAAVGCAPLLALHVWGGAYAYRLDIGRFLGIVGAANRKGIFDPDERSSFIAKSSNYARKQARKRRFPWWLIMMGVVFLTKILAALSGHGP